MSAVELSPSEDLHFAFEAHDPTAPATDTSFGAELIDFNVYCSPSTLRIHTSPTNHFDLILHNIDGLRQQGIRQPGLDATARVQDGTIEVPDQVLRSNDSAVSGFIKEQLAGQKFTTVPISAFVDHIELTVGTSHWKLVRTTR